MPEPPSALVVTAWSYAWDDAHPSRWHVMAVGSRRAMCGAVPRSRAIVRQVWSVTQARRESGPICLRCARWLADRTPRRGKVVRLPR